MSSNRYYKIVHLFFWHTQRTRCMTYVYEPLTQMYPLIDHAIAVPYLYLSSLYIHKQHSILNNCPSTVHFKLVPSTRRQLLTSVETATLPLIAVSSVVLMTAQALKLEVLHKGWHKRPWSHLTKVNLANFSCFSHGWAATAANQQFIIQLQYPMYTDWSNEWSYIFCWHIK
jgi:hypothetical protein